VNEFGVVESNLILYFTLLTDSHNCNYGLKNLLVDMSAIFYLLLLFCLVLKVFCFIFLITF